jgi:hypothetical protein
VNVAAGDDVFLQNELERIRQNLEKAPWPDAIGTEAGLHQSEQTALDPVHRRHDGHGDDERDQELDGRPDQVVHQPGGNQTAPPVGRANVECSMFNVEC